jgi:hypothetical protein
MMDRNDITSALRGKSRVEQLRVIQSVMDAAKRGRFPVSLEQAGLLSRFVAQLQQNRAVDDALLIAVSIVVRHYEQHLIALTRSVR